MTHKVVVLLALFALGACGGGRAQSGPPAAGPDEEPRDETSGGDQGADSSAAAGGTSGAAASGSGEAGAFQIRPGEENEFKLRKSDKSSRGGGVTASQIQPTKTQAAMRFIVVDKDNGPIKGIVIALTNDQGQKFHTSATDANGYAEALIPVGHKYELVFLSLGRRDIAAKVPISSEPMQNIKLTLRYKRYTPPVRPVGAPATSGPRLVLDGVYFDTGKAVLREDSFEQLDNVVEYMIYNEGARIEISGHTDNVGNARRNKRLSQKRADACRDYLIAAGIAAGRINAVGYGSEQPVASNDTEQGRQQNRRIEAIEL